jgi:hypothetical protein
MIMQYKKSAIFLLLPFFLIRNLVFDWRKSSAVRKAERLSVRLGKNVYVFQTGRRFTVGTREELRRINRAGRKNLKRATGSRLFDFDYRNSLVYTASHETKAI